MEADEGDLTCYILRRRRRHLGELIEYGHTEKVFINPIKKQTEDYITGRFG